MDGTIPTTSKPRKIAAPAEEAHSLTWTRTFTLLKRTVKTTWRSQTPLEMTALGMLTRSINAVSTISETSGLREIAVFASAFQTNGRNEIEKNINQDEDLNIINFQIK